MQLQFNFTYDRNIFGNSRENKVVKRTYSGAMAWFMFSTTALEINYMDSTQITTYSEDREHSSGFVIIDQQNTIGMKVYGAGIRQALAPLDSRFVPMLSFGYAKQFVTDGTTMTVKQTDGSTQTFTFVGDKKRYDSAFGAFILNIKLTELFTLNGTVKTVFRAFEWNEAKNSLQYLAGFSWFF